jgi:hypothetical protein
MKAKAYAVSGPNLTAHQKTFDEIISEYLNLNPLILLTAEVPKRRTIQAHLSVNGFGVYTYKQIDNALLGALAVWADKDQVPVHSVLHMM